jgi:hypothetical protein
MGGGFPDPDCLIDLVFRRHHHEQIDVAVLVRLPVGIRAKKNDLVGLEFIHNLIDKPLDRGQRDQPVFIEFALHGLALTPNTITLAP